MESYRSPDFSTNNRISWMIDGSVANRFTERSSVNSLALLHSAITTQFADIRFLCMHITEMKENAYLKDESNIFKKNLYMVFDTQHDLSIFALFLSSPSITDESFLSDICHYVFSEQLRSVDLITNVYVIISALLSLIFVIFHLMLFPFMCIFFYAIPELSN